MSQSEVELQTLVGIKSLEDLHHVISHGITEETFVVYPNVWKLVIDYAEEFKETPSAFLLREHFGLTLPVNPLDLNFCVWELRKADLKRRVFSTIERGSEFLIDEEDPERAVEFYVEEFTKLKRKRLITSSRTDKDALQRLDSYLERQKALKSGIAIGLQTGLTFLDDDMVGLMPGNLLGIIGNTTVGKSWLLEYMAVAAYMKNQARVLFVSPEMTIGEVEARWDTLTAKFLDKELSNMAIVRGRGLETKEYKTFLETVSKRDDWLTYDANDEGKPFSVPVIESLASKFKPDFIAVDGLPLLGHDNKRSQQWERLADIAYGLKNLAKAQKYVIVITNQATRDAEGKEIPGLADSGNSYAFVQACDQVITLANPKDGRANVKIIRLAKRRVGEMSNKVITIPWDVDRGIIG